MKTKNKKLKIVIFFTLAFCAGIFGFFEYQNDAPSALALTTAETSSKMKTAVFRAFQEQNIITSTNSTTTDFTVFVGENAPVIKSAYLEVEGVTKAIGSQTITVDIKQSAESFPTARARTFVIDSTGTDSGFDILYAGNDQTGNDLTSYLAGIITSPSPYTFSVKVSVLGNSVSLLSAKLVLTYQYTPPSSGTTVPNSNTLYFSALANRDILASGSATTTDFTVFVGEPSPIVKSAFFHVKGVTKAIGSQTITVDIKQSAESFPTARARTFVIDSTGTDSGFDILYAGNDQTGNDLTSYLAGIITSPTSYPFSIKVNVSGADVSLLSATLVLTYRFDQTAGGLPATGSLISPTFDTYTTNGVNYNWIMWKGSQPAGSKVRLQLATSNCAGGQTDAPTCGTGGWGSGTSNYMGSDCTNATYFEQSATDVSNEVACPSAHNNKRYFRYKVILCSASDCASSGAQNPQVNDVIVNWSL
jgi:hypothetical protein